VRYDGESAGDRNQHVRRQITKERSERGRRRVEDGIETAARRTGKSVPSLPADTPILPRPRTLQRPFVAVLLPMRLVSRDDNASCDFAASSSATPCDLQHMRMLPTLSPPCPTSLTELKEGRLVFDGCSSDRGERKASASRCKSTAVLRVI
jgi:hypothetical protein